MKAYTPSTIAILEAVRRIPRGRVMTYGSVALAAGMPNGARQVVRVLHTLSGKEKLPWHRVVGSASGGRKGEIRLPFPDAEEQARLLAGEGVEVDGRGRIELARYGWSSS